MIYNGELIEENNMQCPFCKKGEMILQKEVMLRDAVEFESLVCNTCKELILTGKQMRILAKKYSELRKSKSVTFAKWGNSLAIRIPKDLVQEYKLAPGKRARFTKEKNGIKILPE